MSVSVSAQENEFLPRYWPTWVGLCVLWTLALLPMFFLWLTGIFLGATFQIFPTKLKRIAETNVKLCFPTWNDHERKRLVRHYFRLLGVSTLTYGLCWWASPKRLRKLVRVRNRQYYDEALRAGRNIILFSPHFLALDICGIMLSSERPMVSMYRAPRNRVLDRMLRKRARFGGILCERKENMMSLIRQIRKGKPFYYLPDQDPGGADSVFVPLFGVPAATLTAFSRIASITNAIVIPCYNRILPWGKGFEIRFEAPLAEYPSEDPIKDAIRMNQEIEREVSLRPEQYLWSYRRFKTRPFGSPPLYK